MNGAHDRSRVLSYLNEVGEGLACPFQPIMSATKLDRARVRRACRVLARQGFAEYARPLWTEDGEPLGAGYGITRSGVIALAEREERAS